MSGNPVESEALEFVFGKLLVRARLRRGAGETLVVNLHGAIAPELQPFFPGFWGCSAHQLSVSDPVAAGSSSLTTGWYLGVEGESLPPQLLQKISEIGQELGAPRRVYVGGSAGGFAALVLAGLDPGSVAVSVSPQTNLARYGGTGVQSLILECFASEAELPPEANLLDWLPKRWESNAVILASSGDVEHLYGHVLPLIMALKPEQRRTIILEVSYSGVYGHKGGSVPTSRVESWVRAVLESPRFVPEQILSQFHGSFTDARLAGESGGESVSRTRSEGDHLIAQRLVRLAVQESQVGLEE